MGILIKLLFCVAFLLLPLQAQATDYYVDGTLAASCAGGAGTSYIATGEGARTCGGSDGTVAWKTIYEANINLEAGDTVYLREWSANTITFRDPYYVDGPTAGYECNDIYSVGKDAAKQCIAPENSGTDGHWITYLPYPGETVNLIGNGQRDLYTYTYGINLTNKSYIRVSGLYFYNVTSFYWSNHGHHFEIDNNTFAYQGRVNPPEKWAVYWATTAGTALQSSYAYCIRAWTPYANVSTSCPSCFGTSPNTVAPDNWTLVGTPSEFRQITSMVLKITADSDGEGMSRVFTTKASTPYIITSKYKNSNGGTFQYSVYDVTDGKNDAIIALTDFPNSNWAIEPIKGTPAPIAGGTADAITADYSPDIELADGLLVAFVASETNVTTTPTFSPDGLTPRTIVDDGGNVLKAGEIKINTEYFLSYDATGTKWKLIVPLNWQGSNTFTTPAECTSIKVTLQLKSAGDAVTLGDIQLGEIIPSHVWFHDNTMHNGGGFYTSDVITNGLDWTGATGTTPPNDWDLVGTPSDLTIDSGELKITADANGEGVSQANSITTAATYTLGFYYRNTEGDTVQYAIHNDTLNTDIQAPTDLPSSTTKKFFVMTKAIPAATTVSVRFLAKTTGDIVWIDNVSFGTYSDNGSIMKIGNDLAFIDTASHNTFERNYLYHGGHEVFSINTAYNVWRNNTAHNEPWWRGPSDQCMEYKSDDDGDIYDSQNDGRCGHRVFNMNGHYATTGHNLVEGNRLGHGGPNPAGGVGGTSLDIGTGYNIVRYNDTFNAPGFGIDLGTSVAAYSPYNHIYNNTAYRHGFGNLIDNATLWAYRCGIRVGFSDALGPYQVVKNNLIFDTWVRDNSSSYAPLYISGTNGAVTHTITNNYEDLRGVDKVDPLFMNGDITQPLSSKTLPDLRLKAGSPFIDNAGLAEASKATYLTEVHADDTGTGTTLRVANARYFQDGTNGADFTSSDGVATPKDYNSRCTASKEPYDCCSGSGTGTCVFQADYIAVGTSVAAADKVQIASIDLTTTPHTITLAESIDREDGDYIWLYKKSDGEIVLYGTSPESGAHEYNPDVTQYAITLTIAGATGSVTSSVDSSTCTTDCVLTYNSGTVVTLTATPSGENTFTGWSGAGGCSGTGTCELTLSEAKAATATFAAGVTSYTLTGAKDGTGTGAVTSNDSAINCGASCGPVTYTSGTVITLSAIPTSGNHIAAWTGGGCSGTGSTCVVTVSENTTVTVTFDADATPFTITIDKGGYGDGTVTDGDAGDMDCGSTCSDTYIGATTVTLHQVPEEGSTFVGWSGGGCSGTSDCEHTVSADVTITAIYSKEYTITAAKGGNGTVDIITADSETNINCGSTCSGASTGGTTVRLYAVCLPGTLTWSNCTDMGDGYCSVILAEDITITTTCTIATVTSSVVGSVGGTITPAGAQQVAYGEDSPEFTIAPYNGWKTKVLAGTCGATGTGTTYTKTNAVSDCTVTAEFEQIKLMGWGQ